MLINQSTPSAVGQKTRVSRDQDTPKQEEAPTADSFQASSWSEPGQLYFSRPGATTLTPASRLGVRHVAQRLEEILSDQESPVAQFYETVKPTIEDTLQQALALENSPLAQDDVASLADRFSKISSYPMDVLFEMADLGSGGSADFSFEYDPDYHRVAREELIERHGAQAEAELIARKAEELPGKLENLPASPGKSYLIGSRSQDWDRELGFQYQYVYAPENALEPIDYVRNRENGQVFIPIPETSNANADGQHLTLELRNRHEHLEAHHRKLRDAEQFDRLGLDSWDDMQSLKRTTNQLLEDVVSEWKELDEPEMKTAVESVLYGVLEKTACSYPIQVSELLADPEQRTRHIRALSGPRDSDALKLRDRNDPVNRYPNQNPEVVGKAMDWLQERAERDAVLVSELFAPIGAPG